MMGGPKVEFVRTRYVRRVECAGRLQPGQMAFWCRSLPTIVAQKAKVQNDNIIIIFFVKRRTISCIVNRLVCFERSRFSGGAVHTTSCYRTPLDILPGNPRSSFPSDIAQKAIPRQDDETHPFHSSRCGRRRSSNGDFSFAHAITHLD